MIGAAAAPGAEEEDRQTLMAKRAVQTTISEASTIADVVTALDNPIEYVRRVLEKLERCRRAHGDAQVRLGVRGRPECPNYLIEYVLEDAKSHKKSIRPDAAYSGSTHRELAPKHVEEARNWSPEEMNITAVAALIGRLRNPRDASRQFMRIENGHQIRRQGSAQAFPAAPAKKQPNAPEPDNRRGAGGCGEGPLQFRDQDRAAKPKSK